MICSMKLTIIDESQLSEYSMKDQERKGVSDVELTWRPQYFKSYMIALHTDVHTWTKLTGGGLWTECQIHKKFLEND